MVHDDLPRLTKQYMSFVYWCVKTSLLKGLLEYLSTCVYPTSLNTPITVIYSSQLLILIFDLSNSEDIIYIW